MDYYSPLRYPGGKGKITDFFKEIIKDNLLYDGTYIEPYAGGASIALSLLFNEYVSKIIINDFDYSVYSFWYSVLNYTDELCKLIKDTPVNTDTWEKQRYIQNSNSSDVLSIGFSTFYLNRTNRSGIINAGIIGGRNQTGKWKIDARFNKNELINRIQRIAFYKKNIELYNLDAIILLKKFKKKLSRKTLFYFDPPYYIKGKDLYLNYYKDKDHVSISNEIKKLNLHKWIVTYDNVKFIKDLYNEFRQMKYLINYSALKASKGEELVILSNNLYISPSPSLASATFL